MKYVLISLIVLTLMGLKVYGQHGNTWEGSDVPGHSFAKFKNLNSRQSFDIKVAPQSKAINLNYVITRTEGELILVIRSAKDKVLEKNITGTEKGSVTIDRKTGQKYRIYIIGVKAAGNFDITYSEK